jgi:tRNA pseudouridine(55) synthase
MRKYVILEKVEGETPLEALNRYRSTSNVPQDVPVAYAGRLDPMASGKLILLLGEECKRQEAYHGLDKEYDFEVLFGFESDTGDILGLTKQGNGDSPGESEIASSAKSLKGMLTLPYPLFSSKTVKGKPLFLWTLENRLAEIEIPSATTRVYSCTFKGMREVSRCELLTDILARIAKVTPVTEASKQLGADFRRKDVTRLWKEHLATCGASLCIAKFSVACSSGTYIRALAPHIASKLNTEGLAYSIHRTRIGTFLPLPLLPGGGVWIRSW